MQMNMLIDTSDSFRVFISSTMKDLADERIAAKEVVEDLLFIPVLAEDLGAGSKSPHSVTLSYVRQSDIYIGIFWEKYGEASYEMLSPTEEEYQTAKENNKPILIYIKEPAINRDKLLTRFLREIKDYNKGHVVKNFTSVNELKTNIKNDIIKEISALAKQQIIRHHLETIPSSALVIEEKENVLQSSGIYRVLQEKIVKRAKDQLDPMVRKYQSWGAVENGCNTLVSLVQKDNYIPNILIGWKNDEINYKGSETVTNIISKKLGIPFKIINMRETGETREVIDECLWVKGCQNILVIDDACYSGSTLKAIHKKIISIHPKIKIRFAVLSTLKTDTLPDLYFESVHNTEELLFPWGWSRLIVGFYDVYRKFGITDRRVVTRDKHKWGLQDIVDDKFTGSVRVNTIKSKTNVYQNLFADKDTFLYILKGVCDVRIDDKSSQFLPGEYIFIPRGVKFVVNSTKSAQFLELLSGNE